MSCVTGVTGKTGAKFYAKHTRFNLPEELGHAVYEAQSRPKTKQRAAALGNLQYFMDTIGKQPSQWKFLMYPKVFLLLGKYFMLLFGSMRFLWCKIWNCVNIIFILLLMLPKVLFLVHILSYIFSNRAVVLFILWILWLYSSTIKPFKCVVRTSCWSKS